MKTIIVWAVILIGLYIGVKHIFFPQAAVSYSEYIPLSPDLDSKLFNSTHTAEPLQEKVHLNPIYYPDRTKLEFLYSYQIQAKLLSKKHYNDRDASLAPWDFALGWGVYEDPKVVSELNISQSQRFGYYSYKNPPPAPRNQIKNEFSNNHLIPSSPYILEEIENMQVGGIILIQGYLVMAQKPGQGKWISSTRRTDSGNGACELIYVTNIKQITNN